MTKAEAIAVTIVLASGSALPSPRSLNSFLFRTKKAAAGSTANSILRRMNAGIRSEIFAPRYEPAMPVMTDASATLRFTRRFLMNRIVVRAVPQVEESLLVATAMCGGSPAAR